MWRGGREEVYLIKIDDTYAWSDKVTKLSDRVFTVYAFDRQLGVDEDDNVLDYIAENWGTGALMF